MTEFFIHIIFLHLDSDDLFGVKINITVQRPYFIFAWIGCYEHQVEVEIYSLVFQSTFGLHLERMDLDPTRPL